MIWGYIEVSACQTDISLHISLLFFRWKRKHWCQQSKMAPVVRTSYETQPHATLSAQAYAAHLALLEDVFLNFKLQKEKKKRFRPYLMYPLKLLEDLPSRTPCSEEERRGFHPFCPLLDLKPIAKLWRRASKRSPFPWCLSLCLYFLNSALFCFFWSALILKCMVIILYWLLMRSKERGLHSSETVPWNLGGRAAMWHAPHCITSTLGADVQP